MITEPVFKPFTPLEQVLTMMCAALIALVVVAGLRPPVTKIVSRTVTRYVKVYPTWNLDVYKPDHCPDGDLSRSTSRTIIWLCEREGIAQSTPVRSDPPTWSAKR